MSQSLLQRQVYSNGFGRDVGGEKNCAPVSIPSTTSGLFQRLVGDDPADRTPSLNPFYNVRSIPTNCYLYFQKPALKVSIPSTTSGLFQLGDGHGPEGCRVARLSQSLLQRQVYSNIKRRSKKRRKRLSLNPFYNVRSIPTPARFDAPTGFYEGLNPFYNVRSIPT